MENPDSGSLPENTYRKLAPSEKYKPAIPAPPFVPGRHESQTRVRKIPDTTGHES